MLMIQTIQTLMGQSSRGFWGEVRWKQVTMNFSI